MVTAILDIKVVTYRKDPTTKCIEISMVTLVKKSMQDTVQHIILVESFEDDEIEC